MNKEKESAPAITEAEILAATAKNILEKIAGGGIPTARELDLLRTQVPAKQVAPNKPGKYQRPLKFYAELYKRSLRSIKRFAAEKKPLDDEPLMWEMLSTRGKPTGTEEKSENGMDSSPIRLEESFFAGEGALAAIERLKKAERERAGAYLRALGGPAQILQNRFKEWVGIIEALRKLAKDEPEIRRANDLTIDKSEMEEAVSAVFAAFRTASRRLPTRAAAKLIAARTREEFVSILDAEIEVLLRTLVEVSAELAKPEPDPAA